MSRTDMVADALTIIRNGATARLEHVDIPYSRIIADIVNLMKQKKLLKNFRIMEEGIKKTLRAYIAYDTNRAPLLVELKRISTPGKRIYRKTGELRKVSGGSGWLMISTSRGVMDDKQARQQNIGGEVICKVR